MAVARAARTLPILGVDIAGLPWTEIDFVEDVEYANSFILEKLQDHTAARPKLAVVGGGLLLLTSSTSKYRGTESWAIIFLNMTSKVQAIKIYIGKLVRNNLYHHGNIPS